MRLWRRRRMYVDDLPKTHDARFLLVFLVILVLAFGAVYAVGYEVAGDKVPTGTSVAGVDIGGMSRTHAADVLHSRLDPRLQRPLRAVVDGHHVRVSAAQAGLTLDVEATLDEAMDGTNWDPRHMLKVLGGGDPVHPLFDVDRRRLASALDPLASAVETKPTSSQVSILGGRAVIRPGRPGQYLDLDAAASLIPAAAIAGDDSVTLTLASRAPAVTYHDVTAFVRDRVRPALHGPVAVEVDGHALKVTQAQFAPALRIDDTGGRLRLTLDAVKLFARTKSLLNSLPGEPLDASIAFPNGRPVVVPSREGHVVTPAAWADAVMTAATAHEGRRATAHTVAAHPSFTTADARALHIQSQLGGAGARVSSQLATALRVAALQLDGTIVLPGADFSYARAVGGVSASTVLSPLGAATSRAASRAHLTITQHPGGPMGGRDLQFRNTSVYPVYVRAVTAHLPKGALALTVQIWGTRG